jgi:ADP-L-glycero-D-manno-heptose 6-epimerase
MSLFESHKEGIAHGHQQRDFVYVKDVTEVCYWLMQHRKNSGIYNLGSGKARTFQDLALATFHSMGVEPSIDYIPTPQEIRNSYQYFTEAAMGRLKNAGYPGTFTSLEDGIADYVGNYLVTDRYE